MIPLIHSATDTNVFGAQVMDVNGTNTILQFLVLFQITLIHIMSVRPLPYSRSCSYK